jgi:N-acetylmuramoyl-L-alanine amidase
MWSVVRRSKHPRRRHRLRRTAAAALLLAAVAGLLMPVDGASAAPSAARAPEASGASGVTGVAGSAGSASVAAARPTLRLGSRGSAVTSLQNRLTALRYDVGGVDGVFGSATFHAVVAFQKVNNLARDGIVGPATWTRLDRPLVPRPRYSHSGYSVEVNLTKQVLYLVRNSSIVRIVDASSGKASTPTPSGNFSVGRRIDGWRTSSLGRLWRPNYFYRGYAIHGYTSVPNYPASHGCVRVTIAAMNRLWTIIGIGTPVHLYHR